MTLMQGWTEIPDDQEGRNLRHFQATYLDPAESDEPVNIVTASRDATDAACTELLHATTEHIKANGGKLVVD